MKLTNLEPAWDSDVEKWLSDSLQLTPYQKSVLSSDEVVRYSPFKFYKRREQEKVNLLWRLTIIFYPVYLILLMVGMPFTWIIRGRWGFGQKFYDNFHAKWVRKLGF